MALQTRHRTLPRLLVVEALLAVGILLTGVVPFLAFTRTALTAPGWFEPVWRIPLASLAVLWLVLICHAALDVV